MSAPQGFTYEAAPAAEVELIASEIRNQTSLLNPDEVIARYARAGFAVNSDPFSPDAALPIKAALTSAKPYSLIRIGDGEISFLAFGANPATPVLDRYTLERSQMQFPDRFRVSEPSMAAVRDGMRTAIARADTVGVLGLWRPRLISPEDLAASLVAALPDETRGIVGHWRAVGHMLHLAETGTLDGKQICSAHIYFGLLEQLPNLISAASRTVCLTNRPDAVIRLRKRFRSHEIEHIPLNSKALPPDALPATPSFLDTIRGKLPEDMTGQLVLIGAGVWAEFYCTMVKDRGGVAVDIGSGFDILSGLLSRPAHRRFFNRPGASLEGFLDSL